jgi:hypothetical protein
MRCAEGFYRPVKQAVSLRLDANGVAVKEQAYGGESIAGFDGDGLG